MYIPAHFAETRLPVLHDAIEQARLAMLVTFDGTGMEAGHLPVILDRGRGAFGTLTGHLARPNPQWRTAVQDVPALLIFTGPDAYISPSWYPSKAEAGKAVPTWNYVTVHAYGRLRTFDDPDRLCALLEALTRKHEAGRPEPWGMDDAPEGYIAAMMRGIIGIEIEIERIEGKWKMSQNRSAEDRQGVVYGLEAEADEAASSLAQLMRAMHKD